jgi:hypothetical protein
MVEYTRKSKNKKQKAKKALLEATSLQSHLPEEYATGDVYDAIKNPSAETLSPDVVMQLQRDYGNGFVSELVQRAGIDSNTISSAPASIQREVVKIGNGEKLEYEDGLSKEDKKAQVKEAKAIIKRIKKKYGITVSSKKSVQAVVEDYQLDKEEKKEANPRPWQLKELQALEAALDHYAPILGKNRKDSSQSGTPQGITNIGAMDRGVSVNDAGENYFEDSTLGETFNDSKNITIFKSLTDFEGDFPGDNPKNVRQTIVHELSHGLIQGYLLDDFVKIFRDYWANEDDRVSGDSKIAPAGVEAPITDYGATNAAEDLAETAGYYFEAPDVLESGNKQASGDGSIPVQGHPGNPAPRRKSFFEGVVEDWTKSKEVADFHMKSRIVLSVTNISNAEEKDLLDSSLSEALEAFKQLSTDQQLMYTVELMKLQIHTAQLIQAMQELMAPRADGTVIV